MNVPRGMGAEPMYEPIPLNDYFEPKFQLPNGIEKSVMGMCTQILPDSLIERIVDCTNQYAQHELKDHTDKYKEVSKQHLARNVHLFALFTANFGTAHCPQPNTCLSLALS